MFNFYNLVSNATTQFLDTNYDRLFKSALSYLDGSCKSWHGMWKQIMWHRPIWLSCFTLKIIG